MSIVARFALYFPADVIVMSVMIVWRVCLMPGLLLARPLILNARAALLGTCLLLTGLLIPVSSAQPGEVVPRFEETACQFRMPRIGTRCGDLIVYEDRSDPNSRTIRLHLGIVPPVVTPSQPDPVVYLDGGPGGWSLYWIAFRSELLEMYPDRALIVFDQRGIGYSQPALDCPELTQFYFEYLAVDISIDEAEWLASRQLAACRARLAEQGINLSAYTSAASAADLEDMRVTLGYDQWNLHGVSYGTRLALTAMRDFPGGIRSAVLDSVVPLQVDNLMNVAALADQVYRVFFDGCAADARCAQNYPDLEATFYALADRLDAQPVTVDVRHPLTNITYPMLINGYSVRNMLFTSLYSTRTIPDLPRIITDAAQGRFAGMADEIFFNLVGFEFFSIGMYYSVNCADEIMFRPFEDYAAVSERFPQQQYAFDSRFYVKNCNIWEVARSDVIETLPVVSDIPTLLIAGEYDPITPPMYAEMAAETLSNSTVLIFPGTGHGASFDSACASALTRAFVSAPGEPLDTGCISRMGPPMFR